jgi:UDP-glucose 4-epimerase
MKAIVTGAAGFIGSHITDFLLNKGFTVIGIDNLSNGFMENLKQAKKNKKFKFVKESVCNKSKIAKHFKNVDYVFHLAACASIAPSFANPEKFYKNNTTGTLNILECCRENKIKKLVFAASSACYGDAKKLPISESSEIKLQNPYGLTKYLAEEMILKWCDFFNIEAICLRLFNVYGPRSKSSGYGAVMGVFLTQKLYNKPFTVIGDGSYARDFVYVEDVARAFYLAAKSKIKKDVFNVGYGKAFSINDLTEILKGEKIFLPKRPLEVQTTLSDISKIKKHLKWTPKVSFKEGVKICLKHINDYKDAPVWNKNKILKATKAWLESGD